MPHPDVPQCESSTRNLLRLPEVIRRVGMSRSWICKSQKDGGFPRSSKVGRSTAWDSHAVDAWIARQLTDGAA